MVRPHVGQIGRVESRAVPKFHPVHQPGGARAKHIPSSDAMLGLSAVTGRTGALVVVYEAVRAVPAPP